MAKQEKSRAKSSSPIVKFFLVLFMLAMAFFILGPLLWLAIHAFVTNWTYPNIYPDGKVCISILHPPGTDSMNSQEKAEERWRPILGVE